MSRGWCKSARSSEEQEVLFRGEIAVQEEIVTEDADA
jgi:hypothetical protein